MTSSVLIIASPYDAQLLRRALEDAGYGVHVATGKEDIVKLASLQPQVIVLSHHLAGVDAEEVLRGLRRESPRYVPVVLIGRATGEITTLAQAIRFGADHLILRPVEPDLLLGKVSAALERERLSQEVELTSAEDDVEPDFHSAASLRSGDTVGDEDDDPGGRASPDDAGRDAAPPAEPEPAEPEPAEPEPAEPEPAEPGPADRPDAETARQQAEDKSGRRAGGGLATIETKVDDLPAAEQRPPVAQSPAFSDEELDDDQQARDVAPRLVRVESDLAEKVRQQRLDPTFFTRDTLDGMLPPSDPSSIIGQRGALASLMLDSDSESSLEGDAVSPFEARLDDAPVEGPPDLRLWVGTSPAQLAPLPRLPAAGHLRRYDFPQLLRLIQLRGWAGALGVRRTQAHKVVYFDDGVPIFAESSQPFDGLADFLVRQGMITRAQYDRCGALVADGNRQVSAVLVDIGAIKLRELFPLVRRQVVEIIYSLFGWVDGEFELLASVRMPDERVRLDEPPEGIIAEGVRRKFGLDRLLERVGHPELRYRRRVANDDPQMQSLLRWLEADERAAFFALDGSRELVTVERDAKISRLRLYQLIYSAIVLDLVELETADSAENDAFVKEAFADSGIDRARLLAKHAQVLDGDYFTLLGLTRDASGREVDVAFRQLIKRFDPSALPASLAEELATELDEIRQVLHEAYRVLADGALREAYGEHV